MGITVRGAFFGLYWAAYGRSSTSSRHPSCDYHRNAASGKTIVQRDIENRCCASLFDICRLHIFHRDARTYRGFISYRAGIRLRNNYYDLRGDWKRDPQKESQEQEAHLIPIPRIVFLDVHQYLHNYHSLDKYEEEYGKQAEA